MAHFTGERCLYCGNSYTENDDIVVCPDCGTPHHRDCYNKKGECGNILLHGSGYVWQSSKKAVAEENADEEAHSDADDRRWETFIETFGKDMDSEKLQSFRKFFGADSIDELNERRRENIQKTRQRLEARDIFGVSEREITSFQCTVNLFAVDRYRKIAQGGKRISFNILAGFLNPFYSFYFRAVPIGIFLAVLDFILRVPYTASMYYSFNMFVSAEMLEMLEKLYESYATVTMAALIAIMLIICMFFDYAYLRWMTGKIKAIRARFEDDSGKPLGKEYYQELSRVGRPRLLRGLADYMLTWMTLSIVLFFTLNLMNPA